MIPTEDIHGTITKLKRDVPDYLYAPGSKGNVILFYADLLEDFLGTSLRQNRGGVLTRLFRASQ